jgi:hypothetical protein
VLERCLAVWVVDDSIREELRGDRPLETAKAQLDNLSEGLRERGIQVETLVKEGDPLAEILLAAEQYDIAAIAACPSNAKGVLRWSAPSFTREILRPELASRPVRPQSAVGARHRAIDGFEGSRAFLARCLAPTHHFPSPDGNPPHSPCRRPHQPDKVREVNVSST